MKYKYEMQCNGRRFSVEVDTSEVLRYLYYRAARSKKGVAKAVNGAVVIKFMREQKAVS